MNQETIKNRYEFVLLFDVVDGNPNGDPDAGNAPRVDAETGHGLVTDVCIKRKVRNYIELLTQERPELQDTYRLFIRQGAMLNDTLKENAKAIAVNYPAFPKEKTLSKEEKKDFNELIEKANQEAMCRHYYDVRTFGAVMGTGEETARAGQVRGAVQMTFSRSIDPINDEYHSITRMAKTGNEKQDNNKAKQEDKEKENDGPNQTMGGKYTVSYGLYRCHGFVTPAFANKTGFSETDLELFWQALENMFEIDHSAARGLMSTRKLIVFKHESSLGNAPAHKLFELVKIERKNPEAVPRCFNDYSITIDKSQLPKGVEILELI